MTDTTLLSFAKYIFLRIQNGKYLDEQEKFNLYQVYVDWAVAAGEDYLHKISFYRHIVDFGFQRYSGYDKDKRNMRTLYEPNAEDLKYVVTALEDNLPDVSVVITSINGQKYKVTTQYQLLNS